MSNCIIGFRNGKRLTINVSDAERLVKDIVDGIKKSPSSPVQWFCERGVMLNVSEVIYIMPSAAVVTGGDDDGV